MESHDSVVMRTIPAGQGHIVETLEASTLHGMPHHDCHR